MGIASTHERGCSCGAGDVFVCEACGEVRGACQGQCDDEPGVCDACWYARHRDTEPPRPAPEQARPGVFAHRTLPGTPDAYDASGGGPPGPYQDWRRAGR